MTRRWLCLLTIVAAACGGPTAGSRVRQPPAPGITVATSLTSEPGGMRVLANGRAGYGDSGLLATSASELDELWSDVGLRGRPPAVDFVTHVVLGTNFEDGVCQPELVAAHVDEAGILTFEAMPDEGACIALAVRVARVVAVPRAMLPARFTWRLDRDHGFTFELAPRTKPGASSVGGTRFPDIGARERIAVRRGVVVLPPAGRIALRTLDDGRQVWVARRGVDDISVLLADRGLDDARLRARVSWNDKAHRFHSDHDSRGLSTNGDAPLVLLTYAREGSDRIAIGDAVPATPSDAPIVSRDAEPELEGPAQPYETTTPIAFDALAEGTIGVVAHDLVHGVDGPPRLCTLPEGKLRRFLRGCPDSAPTLAGATSERRRGIRSTHGPLAIRKRGMTADLVIDLGQGSSGWVVDQQLAKPTPRGASRTRGQLSVGKTVDGLTTGAGNGFEPSCVAAAAHGSPDETWNLAVPKSGTYIIELVSKYDGALAVLDAAGKPVACNDDANGHYRRSVVEVELPTGTAQIVVDGFGGHAGGYQLTVREQRKLPALVVGTPVRGDTTGEVNLESHGCYAPAGDHRYTIEITNRGTYTFRVDTPGWAPMISVLAKQDGFGCYTTAPPLVDLQLLEPGTYFVVIDGASEKQTGPYTLTVMKCSSDDRDACRAEARR